MGLGTPYGRGGGSDRVCWTQEFSTNTGGTAMRNVIVIGIVALALAAPATAGSSTLVVAMRDPGCHWFAVGGKYSKSVVRHGSVRLVNRDEAALRIKGPGGTRIDRVGAA